MLLEEFYKGRWEAARKGDWKLGVEQTLRKIPENFPHLHTGNLRSLKNVSTEGNHSNYQF